MEVVHVEFKVHTSSFPEHIGIFSSTELATEYVDSIKNTFRYSEDVGSFLITPYEVDEKLKFSLEEKIEAHKTYVANYIELVNEMEAELALGEEYE